MNCSKILAICSCLMVSINLHAENYTCGGNVTGVGIDPISGSILVENIGPLVWPRLCSVERETNSISPEACRIIYTTLLTAQTTGKPVRMWFRSPGACDKETHVPWYPLKDWYFGPVIED